MPGATSARENFLLRTSTFLRPRKLLLRKKELEKLQVKIKEKGLTIIPTRVFLSDRGLAKIEVALAKGKKLHDKRDTIKMREAKRELQRINKMH